MSVWPLRRLFAGLTADPFMSLCLSLKDFKWHMLERQRDRELEKQRMKASNVILYQCDTHKAHSVPHNRPDIATSLLSPGCT